MKLVDRALAILTLVLTGTLPMPASTIGELSRKALRAGMQRRLLPAY